MQIPKSVSCKQYFKYLHIIALTMSVYISNYSLHKFKFEPFCNQLWNTSIQHKEKCDFKFKNVHLLRARKLFIAIISSTDPVYEESNFL
jgi:hypothetical protein